MYFQKHGRHMKNMSAERNGKNLSKAHNKKVKSKKKELLKWKVPQTVQDTIPYLYVYQNGIMELTPGVFSKSYILGDANFKISSGRDRKRSFRSIPGCFLHLAIP